ncbi:hypothetical protein MMC25_001951 [Agyrium rufum]|nr:hypothetical protein [Agyrium rufum]
MAHPLPSCINSLQSSIHLLNSSIDILGSSVNDYPRLRKVLQTTRHFHLLPTSVLQVAQSQLLSSIVPELDTLFNRIEAHLEKLARREKALQARSELLEGRLSAAKAQQEGSKARGYGYGHGRTGSYNTARLSQRTNDNACDEGERSEAQPEEIELEENEGDEVDEELERQRKELKKKQMRQKKERLSYAVERLTLQAEQRERQLRQSVVRE